MLETNKLPDAISLFPGLTNRVYFQNPETKEFWFHATSVCETLGFKNVTSALALHCESDEKLQEIWQGKATWFVSEAGCYGLAMGAKNAVAKKFKRWLKHEVLPKLRADGAYVSPSATLEQLIKLQSHAASLQSQLETEQAKTLYMANFIDDGLQQAKTQAKIDWQCESSDVKGDPVVFAKAMIQERDEIAAKLRQYKDFGKAMHFFLSEAHPKILEEAASVWDVPKLPE